MDTESSRKDERSCLKTGRVWGGYQICGKHLAGGSGDPMVQILNESVQGGHYLENLSQLYSYWTAAQ